jgi:hypothetical protein
MEVLSSLIRNFKQITVVHATNVITFLKFAQGAEYGPSAWTSFLLLEFVVDSTWRHGKGRIIQQLENWVSGFVHPPTPPSTGSHLLATLSRVPKFRRLGVLKSL